MLLIAVSSSDRFSSEHTGSMLNALLHALHFPARNIDVINEVVRKTGHFFGYGLLSVFLFIAWRGTLREHWPHANRLWSARWAALAICSTTVVAALDEFHQSFIPSRTSTPRDVLLDTAGAAFMQLLIMAVLTGRKLEREL